MTERRTARTGCGPRAAGYETQGVLMTAKKVARKAMKTAKPVAKKADGEAEVLAKIAAMPAYAKDGKVICFFRADKFMTFGLTGKANHALEKGRQKRKRRGPNRERDKGETK
jgi:hypothetical protein